MSMAYQIPQPRLPASGRSRAELAATFLRCTHTNVFRCDILLHQRPGSDTWGEKNGVPNKGRGHHFIAGVGVLSDEDMINFAISKGFSC